MMESFGSFSNHMDKANNFDFLRLLLASLVIVSHSFPLTGTTGEPLLELTNYQVDFGGLAVKCFFIISGYLIFISLERSKTVLQYLWKRCLRLLPALGVVLVLTLLLVPFLHGGDTSIFSQKDYFTYLPRNLSLYEVQYNIRGVFEGNPYPGVINGSLWTLSYEFTMYLSLLALFAVRSKPAAKWLLLGIFATLVGLIHFYPHLADGFLLKNLNLASHHLYDLGAFFIGGSLLAAMRFNTIPKRNTVTAVAFALLLVLTALGFFKEASHLLLPIIIIGFGLAKTPYINNWGERLGDLSYGVYIYGFLVQQSLMYFFSLGPYQLMIASLAIALICAYLSWHGVEKRALRLKSKTPVLP